MHPSRDSLRRAAHCPEWHKPSSYQFAGFCHHLLIGFGSLMIRSLAS